MFGHDLFNTKRPLAQRNRVEAQQAAPVFGQNNRPYRLHVHVVSAAVGLDHGDTGCVMVRVRGTGSTNSTSSAEICIRILLVDILRLYRALHSILGPVGPLAVTCMHHSPSG